MKSKEILPETDRDFLRKEEFGPVTPMVDRALDALEAAEAKVEELQKGQDEIISDRDYWRLQYETQKTKIRDLEIQLNDIYDKGKDIDTLI
jgi:hypothetical protein